MPLHDPSMLWLVTGDVGTLPASVCQGSFRLSNGASFKVQLPFAKSTALGSSEPYGGSLHHSLGWKALRPLFGGCSQNTKLLLIVDEACLST
jgi:hypothetical protein